MTEITAAPADSGATSAGSPELQHMTWADVSRCASPLVKTVHAWWTAHRRANGLADRGDLDPAALKGCVANLIIADAEPEPFRVRYRLVGTKVAQYTGFDFTGRYLDALGTPDLVGHWQRDYWTAYRERRPVLGSTVEPTTTGNEVTFEFGIFPLSRGADAVAQFVSVEDYFGFDLTSAQLLPWGVAGE